MSIMNNGCSLIYDILHRYHPKCNTCNAKCNYFDLITFNIVITFCVGTKHIVFNEGFFFFFSDGIFTVYGWFLLVFLLIFVRIEKFNR